MKKVKIEKEEKKAPTEIKCYSNFRGFPMVEFEKFKIGKKKIAAVLANAEQLQKFVDGEFDKEILLLEEGEILEP